MDVGDAEREAELQAALYRERAAFSRKKLRKFFGQHVRVDVSCTDILKNGLIALLQSSIPLCYFLYMLLEDYSSENLFFWLEVDAFENAVFASPDELRQAAQQIYDAYIKEGSDFEVNIDHRTRLPIQNAIDNADQLCFREAKNHLFRLMEPIFLKFKTSELFAQMRKEIGDTSFYSKEARNNALRIILKNLDKTLPPEDIGDNDPFDYGQRSLDLTRALTHVFVKNKLRLEFLDRAPKLENGKKEPKKSSEKNQKF